MSNSFMSPLPTFTLESLVTNGQWTAAQNGSRKKNLAKPGAQKKSQMAEVPRSKEIKPTL